MALATFVAQAALSNRAEATLSFTIGGSWDSEARRTAATNAMQDVVDRYNAYGNFGNHNIYVYYDAGIPTAQANYLGSIGFGGTWPAERVAQHETAHYLGLPSGIWSTWMSDGIWDGARGNALVRQFDGDQAILNGDGAHFWPYGLNYDSEGSEINKQRQVAMVYAMRADLGIGPSAHPSSATAVTMIASDPVGESGFNYKGQWSDGYFAHPGADYFTGNFSVRTPASDNSFTFTGDSLTVNNTNSDHGLCYNGQGTSGVVTIDGLRLDGGWVQNMSGASDLFQIDGNLSVVSDSNIRAKQGHINILANVHGDQTLTIQPADGRYVVRFLSDENTFAGDIVNLARFELAETANFKFVIGTSGVNNAITGASALSTAINGVFELDVSGADYAYGNSWQLVSAAKTVYGASFEVLGFTNDGGMWTDGSYTFDPTTSILTVTPGSDLNSDGMVNLDDWQTFSHNHLTDLSGYTHEQQAARGDIDGDGDNDFADFRLFEYQYDALNGAGALAAISGSFVPEPTSVSLAMFALGAFILTRRDDARLPRVASRVRK